MIRVIVLFSLTAALVAGLWIRNSWFADEDALGPHIPERDVLDSVQVWSATSEDVEFVLTAVFPDEVRSEFDREQLNRHLDGEWTYFRLYVMNHSESPMEHPLLEIESWECSESRLRIVPVDHLLAATDDLRPWFRHGIRSETLELNQTVAGRSVSLVLMALPFDGRFPEQELWRPTGVSAPVLQKGRLGLEELLTFLDHPSGRIGEHILQSARSESPPKSNADR